MFTPYSLIPASTAGSSYADRITGKAPPQEQQKQMSWGNPPAQTKVAKPERTATNVSYIPEATKTMGLTLSEQDIVNRMQDYYAPRGLGYARPDAPDNKTIKNFAQAISQGASSYQQTADEFGSLYADFVEGRMPEEDFVANLQRMQELSKAASGQYNAINKLFDSPMFGSAQTVAGMPQQRNTLGLNPAQRFTLPKETWNMTPQQLTQWIQRYEKDMGSDWIGGKLAWTVGPSLITGAAASGLTGLGAFNPVNSLAGLGIEKLTGINNK
jgi:hypothetical protein